MAENNIPHVQMGQLEITYRELLVKLKTHVTQLDSQTDAMLCVEWIQKLQTLTKPNDIKLRNYLLLQICNQIQTGYLDHPFINLSYLDQDLHVVANCCREWEEMCVTTDDIVKARLQRSVSNMTDSFSDFYISDVDGTITTEVIKSLAMQNIFHNDNGNWEEPNKHFTKPLENVPQNFFRRKYEETLDNLKKAKLKLYLKGNRSLENLVEYLGANFIEKYQSATDELLSIEKSPNMRKQFLAFQLNFSSKFKLMCGDFLNANMAENLQSSEEQFQSIFKRILLNFVEMKYNESRKEMVSTGRASISTDVDINNLKYSEYLKRYIRKQQKQYSRKMQDYESQIVTLKNEISLRDKKQSMQIIEMKCENIIRNEQKTRDQLSESINELESKYKGIVQQIFNELQEQT